MRAPGGVARTCLLLAVLFLVVVGVETSRGSCDDTIGHAVCALTGQGPRSDFAADYVGARALLHGEMAYPVLGPAFAEVGLDWPVAHRNPHPPTMLALALPFALFPYSVALMLWSWLMVAAYALCLRLWDVPWLGALAGAAVLSFVSPFSWGLGQSTPLIMLGTALLLRMATRDCSLQRFANLTALGLLLVVLPKGAGIIVVIPFVLRREWGVILRVAGVGAGIALVTIALRPAILSEYLEFGSDAGAEMIRRVDNAALLPAVVRSVDGAPALVAALFLVAALVVAVFRLGLRRVEPYLWLSVVALPIAWSYSGLALVPLWASRHTQTGVERVLLVGGPLSVLVAMDGFGQQPARLLPVLVVLTGFLLVLWPQSSPASSVTGAGSGPLALEDSAPTQPRPVADSRAIEDSIRAPEP